MFDNWHLKEQYKRSGNRTELSQQLSKNILYAGLFNLVLSPVIFLFAAIFCIFSYGDVSTAASSLRAVGNSLVFF